MEVRLENWWEMHGFSMLQSSITFMQVATSLLYGNLSVKYYFLIVILMHSNICRYDVACDANASYLTYG